MPNRSHSDGTSTGRKLGVVRLLMDRALDEVRTARGDLRWHRKGAHIRENIIRTWAGTTPILTMCCEVGAGPCPTLVYKLLPFFREGHNQGWYLPSRRL